jgi:hypothetical protein
MKWDASWWKLWLDIAQLVLLALLGGYNWLTSRHRVTTSRIDELEESVDERIDLQGTRIIRIEETLKHQPGDDALGVLHDKVNGVSHSVGEIRGEIRAIHRTVNMINEHLISRGAR